VSNLIQTRARDLTTLTDTGAPAVGPRLAGFSCMLLQPRALDVTRVPEMAPVNEIEQDIAAIAKGLNGGNDPLPGRLRYARIRHIRRLGARRVPAYAYG
jgi:hypothetical protein